MRRPTADTMRAYPLRRVTGTASWRQTNGSNKWKWYPRLKLVLECGHTILLYEGFTFEKAVSRKFARCEECHLAKETQE